MSMHPLLAKLEQANFKAKKPEIAIGDSVEVHVKILEGDKERVQIFAGLVISIRGSGTRENFTVRRLINGEGVERTFPMHSPRIADVVVKRKAVVRRAKLYYLRDRIGARAMNLKEKVVKKETTGRSRSRIKARKQKQAEGPKEKAEKPAKKAKGKKKEAAASTAE